jgi:hypothetical protein
MNKSCGNCKWLKVEFQEKCDECDINMSSWIRDKSQGWTVDEIIEELKSIDAFDAAKYFFENYAK